MFIAPEMCHGVEIVYINRMNLCFYTGSLKKEAIKMSRDIFKCLLPLQIISAVVLPRAIAIDCGGRDRQGKLIQVPVKPNIES